MFRLLAKTHHRTSNVEITYYAIKPGCRDLSITCAHNIQGYCKRNRHFQCYVISKPLAYWTHNLRSSVDDRVFVPPLPVSLNELKQRITTELDYRIDICRVTKVSYTEHL